MATRLNQILSFVNVGAGQQATLAHNINVNGLALLPDLLFPDNESFAFVSATTTTLTVINNGSGAGTLNLWLQRQHTIDRAYGASATKHLSPQPLWVGGGLSSGTLAPIVQVIASDGAANPNADVVICQTIVVETNQITLADGTVDGHEITFIVEANNPAQITPANFLNGLHLNAPGGATPATCGGATLVWSVSANAWCLAAAPRVLTIS